MTAVEPVLLSDPRITAIGWADNGEPLLDIRQVRALRLDPRQADADGAFAWLRRGVVERLLAAQAALPAGLALLIVEGYRPAPLQRAYFENHRRELAQGHPDWDADAVFVRASAYVSPPAVAPHGTGGAVDLTLGTVDGIELDLGTAVNASPEQSRNACYTGSPDVTGPARAHRRILVDALSGVGLVNYPTEWWHWSFGERYWAWVGGRAVTRYAPVSWPVRPTPHHQGQGPPVVRSDGDRVGTCLQGAGRGEAEHQQRDDQPQRIEHTDGL